MKYTLKLFVVLALSAMTLPFANAQVQLLDQIVAVVDDDVVMLSELEERVDAVYSRLQQRGTDAPPRESIAPQVLNRLIIERLQLNMGLRAGVRISDAELNQAINQMANAQGLTFDQLVERAHSEGITLGALRSQLRNEMIVSRIQEARVNKRIRITEQEINHFLNSEEGRNTTSAEARLGHILLALPAGANREQVAEANAKAQAIIEKLNNGADFEKMAVTHSAGQNALNGGNLGWTKVVQLPNIFATAVDQLQPGQTTNPLRSDAGLHLIKLYDRRGGGQQFIEQSQVRHILLKPNEIRSEEDTEAMLKGMREDVLAGADFAEIAKDHSEDIGSALSGGDLGWSLPGQFVPRFEETMKATPVGELSQPFRSQFGWHLLQVTDRRTQDFSEDIKRNQAQNILHQRKYQEELQIWLQEIRDEAFIEIKLASN